MYVLCVSLSQGGVVCATDEESVRVVEQKEEEWYLFYILYDIIIEILNNFK